MGLRNNLFFKSCHLTLLSCNVLLHKLPMPHTVEVGVLQLSKRFRLLLCAKILVKGGNHEIFLPLQMENKFY